MLAKAISHIDYQHEQAYLRVDEAEEEHYDAGNLECHQEEKRQLLNLQIVLKLFIIVHMQSLILFYLVLLLRKVFLSKDFDNVNEYRHA